MTFSQPFMKLVLRSLRSGKQPAKPIKKDLGEPWQKCQGFFLYKLSDPISRPV